MRARTYLNYYTRARRVVGIIIVGQLVEQRRVVSSASRKCDAGF